MAHDPKESVTTAPGYIARGEARDSPEFTAGLFDLLITASCKLEDEIIDAPRARRSLVR